MTISAVFPVLYVFYLLVSFFTVRYFIALLQQTSWKAGDYFHILARENQKWLPVVFSLVPAGALILGYGFAGAAVLVFFAIVGSILYGVRESSIGLDRKDSRVRRCLIIWAVLWGVLLAVCQPLSHISGTIPPVLCTVAYLSIPILVPLLVRVERPMEQRAGRRYIHGTGRVRELHRGLQVIVLTGNGESGLCTRALSAILSGRYRCEMVEEPVRNAVEAAQVIRGMQNPLTEILICRIVTENREEMDAMKHILQPSIIIQTAADFWAVSEKGNPEEDALCFANGDDEVLKQCVHTDSVLTYGFHHDNDVCGSIVSMSELGTVLQIGRSRTRKAFFNTSLIGTKSLTALIGAIGVAYALGVPSSEMLPAVSALKEEPHRMELSSEDGISWIDDSANTVPEDGEEAVDTLERFDGEKLLITSGFPQLGAIQETANRHFGAKAAGVCSRIILVGEPVFGLKQGILDAGFIPDHILTAADEDEARETVWKLRNTSGQQTALIESCRKGAFPDD